MDEKEKAGAERLTRRLVLPLDYFACRRALKRLTRAQQLFKHHAPSVAYVPATLPLQDLLPPGTPQEYQHAALESEMARLMPLVQLDITMAEDLIASDFLRPTDDEAMFSSALDSCIGVYTEARNRAWWDFVNPLAWVAFLLRAPLIILEKAGLYDEGQPGTIVKVYGWVVQVLLFLVLARLGIPVAWEKIFEQLVRVFPSR